MHLEQFDKKPFFKIPKNYFENLEEEIRGKINNKNETKRKWIPKSVFYKLSATASIIVIALFLFIYSPSKIKVAKNQNFRKIKVSEQEIMNYLASNDIGLKDITDFIEANNIQIKTMKQNKQKITKKPLTKSEIENYLMEQGIDENLIINSF